jgi:hypothetical protein
MEIKGKVLEVLEPQTFASGFTKQEFIIETIDDKFPQKIKFETIKEKIKLCETLLLLMVEQYPSRFSHKIGACAQVFPGLGKPGGGQFCCAIVSKWSKVEHKTLKKRK